MEAIMSAVKLRSEIKKVIDLVPSQRLESLRQYAHFLATNEPSVLERVQQAEKDSAAGKGVNWRKVRRDV